jgi:hypothetical protein
MKKIFLAIPLLVSLAGCSLKGNSLADKIKSVNTASVPVGQLVGSFVGMFGKNKITLLINKVSADSVVGRSIVAGNDRPFTGFYQSSDHSWSFTVREPGDHKDDGIFNFTIYAFNIDSLTGSWRAYDSKRPEKMFDLTRRQFEYSRNHGEYPEGSRRLLQPEDVENLTKWELSMMRNEIYARHGYSFSKRELREYFESADWYVPVSDNVRGSFTDIEKKNISLIKEYERYAEEFGDEFGR